MNVVRCNSLGSIVEDDDDEDHDDDETNDDVVRSLIVDDGRRRDDVDDAAGPIDKNSEGCSIAASSVGLDEPRVRYGSSSTRGIGVSSPLFSGGLGGAEGGGVPRQRRVPVTSRNSTMTIVPPPRSCSSSSSDAPSRSTRRGSWCPRGSANDGRSSPPPSSPSISRRDSHDIRQDALSYMQMDGTLQSLSNMDNIENERNHRLTQTLWTRLAEGASPPDTPMKELIRRSTFLAISTMTVGAGVLWSLMYVCLGEYTAALMPIMYSACMGSILIACICKPVSSCDVEDGRGYDLFVNAQLGLMLLLPFAVHVALGGLEKSGGVMLWSFMSPVGAAFFRSTSEGLRWYWLYMSITVVLLTRAFWEVEGGDNDGMTKVVGGEEDDDPGGGTIGEVAYFVSGDPSSSSSSSSETIRKLYFLMNIIGVKCVVFAAVYLFARELETEYAKSEEMLLNILPRSIMKRIKRGEFPIVDHVSDVTILFADLVGFTKASTELHPNFLIGLFLRDIFQTFDELAYKHGLEKIKTIGDAYMVVGGLVHGEKLSSHSHLQSADYQKQKPHATNIMLFGVDCFKALRRINGKYNLAFELRIGVHTGPVVAGVLGLKRFAYDVWGDTVNTASRMESNGVPGLIHLSSDMHQAVGSMRNIFDFTCCGEINIKGKGVMTTYLARVLDDGEGGGGEAGM